MHQKLDQIINLLRIQSGVENSMAVDLTALQQAVAKAETTEQSAITLIQGLAAQIAALAQQPTVNPADLQALADQLNADSAGLATAVTTNTPPAPPTP